MSPDDPQELPTVLQEVLPTLPSITYKSDQDGVLFAIVDAAVADMSGWTIEATDPSTGHVRHHPFSLDKAWRSRDTGEFYLAYGGDERVPAWLAVADRSTSDVFIAPDGRRYLA